MVRSKDVLKHFDLSAVEAVVSGSAPLKKKTAEALQAQYPTWKIRQGYGTSQISSTFDYVDPV
jgi:long-subunit acyl-CoA synthetase (AMP-forming)